MAKAEDAISVDAEGIEVRVTHPSKLYFREAGLTKLDLVHYYLGVADGALRGARGRPFVLKRFVDGAGGEPFYQKRAPEKRPAWVNTCTLHFPSGRHAEEVVLDSTASLLWVVNLGCIELHPHAIRATDVSHPDELRIDLDPGPGVPWEDVRNVALEVRALLSEHQLHTFVKTSGSRGMHILVRIAPRWSFDEVRRAALAVAREIERRAPRIATAKWWKEERHGVFLDYNQNAKDRTTCSAYSVRPLPDARVSAPLSWDEVPTCDPRDFTVKTMPQRYLELGDLHAAIDDSAGFIEGLLELADRDEAAGLPDAPWPPHHERREGEAPRVAPSRAKTAPAPKRAPLPVIVVAKAKKKDDALAGLDRWKQRHAAIAPLLAAEDVLVDNMRGRSSTWTRIRINLKNVPVEQRPETEPPDPDEDLGGWS